MTRSVGQVFNLPLNWAGQVENLPHTGQHKVGLSADDFFDDVAVIEDEHRAAFFVGNASFLVDP